MNKKRSNEELLIQAAAFRNAGCLAHEQVFLELLAYREAESKPVAFTDAEELTFPHGHADMWKKPHGFGRDIPLYASPVLSQPVPDEISELCKKLESFSKQEHMQNNKEPVKYAMKLAADMLRRTSPVLGQTPALTDVIAELEASQPANWDGREFETPTGWINELLCLAEHSDKIPNRARDAMRVIANGLRETLSQSVVPEYIGLSVSVDVSTSDENAGHRYFGRVSGVQESDNPKDKNGVVLLVQDDVESNFNELIAPDGWKLVPVEPTPDMIAAGDECWMMTESCADSTYAAMLNAAPALQEGE